MSKPFKVPESEIKHYVPPELSGNIVGMNEEALRPQTVEEIEALQKQAYEEAVKEGYDAGLKKGLQEMSVKASKLQATIQNMINFLQQPLKDLDKQVEYQLAELSILLANLLLQKESKLDAEHIQNLVHNSLEYLPVKSRDIQVRLNSEDIALLNQAEIDTNEQSWRYITDNTISPGGCIIESSASHIDATVETRVQQLVEQLSLHQEDDVDSGSE